MPRPTLASLLEDFRNWNKTQDWMLNKQRDIYGNEDPDTIALNEKLAGIGTADMGMMGSSVGGLAGTFIGKSGAQRLGLQGLMEQAERMHAAGMPREEIWSKTLSMLAPDKNWIHEIPDTEAKIINNSRTGGAVYLEHPLLKQAYPEQPRVKQQGMTNMPEGTAALFVPWRDKLDWSLGDKGAIYYPSGTVPPKQDLLHEFQHWVQEHPENKWTGGGNPEQFDPIGAERARDLLSWRKEMERYMQEKGYDPKRNSDAWMNAETALVNDYYNLGAHEFVPSREIRDEARNYLYGIGQSERANLEDIVSAYGLDKFTSARKPYDMYNRLWGEAQARLTEKRADYTPAQRANIYPWKDLDVPEEELIQLDRKGLARLLQR